MTVEQRYEAMKNYFGYVYKSRECLRKPFPVKFEDKDYISFTNSWSLVLTTESCGGMKLFDEKEEKYPNVVRHIRFDGIKKKFDFGELISDAKENGYQLNNSEVDCRFKYVMHYDDAYYKIGLIDASYSIIDNGEIAMLYHPEGKKSPITIQNSLGICMIMPVVFYDGLDEPYSDKIVIELE